MTNNSTLCHPAVTIVTSALIVAAYVLAFTYFWLNTSKLDSALTFYTEVMEAPRIPRSIEIRNKEGERVYYGKTINNCLKVEQHYACALFTDESKWLNYEDIVEVRVDDEMLDDFSIRQHQHATVISFDDFSIVIPKTTREEAVIELAKVGSN